MAWRRACSAGSETGACTCPGSSPMNQRRGFGPRGDRRRDRALPVRRDPGSARPHRSRQDLDTGRGRRGDVADARGYWSRLHTGAQTDRPATPPSACGRDRGHRRGWRPPAHDRPCGSGRSWWASRARSGRGFRRRSHPRPRSDQPGRCGARWACPCHLDTAPIEAASRTALEMTSSGTVANHPPGARSRG